MKRGPLVPMAVVAVVVVVALAGYALAIWSRSPGPRADPSDAAQVALGGAVYRDQCARCHGANLEGQADWQRRKPDGRLPAPPHDATGHTWHHADAQLFQIMRDGLVPPIAPDGYQSDMPGFGNSLSDDDIWAVLAYIKSRWPSDIRERQRQIGGAARR